MFGKLKTGKAAMAGKSQGLIQGLIQGLGSNLGDIAWIE
jgi:hypothetical protein